MAIDNDKFNFDVDSPTQGWVYGIEVTPAGEKIYRRAYCLWDCEKSIQFLVKQGFIVSETLDYSLEVGYLDKGEFITTWMDFSMPSLLTQIMTKTSSGYWVYGRVSKMNVSDWTERHIRVERPDSWNPWVGLGLTS